MNNLKQFRERANLTQKAVADALGTTQQTYQRWEKGSVKPPIDALQSLSILFQAPLNALLGIPDGTRLGFDPHNHILTGDETGFWGHLGLQFPGAAKSVWYPISARENDRISAILTSCDDPAAVIAISTLNNRLIAFRPMSLSRLWLLDEACDEPDGETHFTDPPHPDFDDTNGLPSLLYQAITAVILCDEDAMDRLGETMVTHAEELLAKAAFSDAEQFSMFIVTRFHMAGGSVLEIQPGEEDLCELITDFEGGSTGLFLEFDDVRDEASHFIPRQNVMMIDAPMTAYREGQQGIVSGLGGPE